MADIFRARSLDDPEGPWLALKLMRNAGDEPGLREALFAREVEIAVRLDHPNVVRVRDHGLHEHRPYLVMDYIGGRDAETFVHRAADRPLPAELVVALGAQAARGLGHAHRRAGPGGASMGIVHRDVSPGNLRTDWTGRTKLLDFGVARIRESQAKLTHTGTLRGKYAYMSPEQTAGDALDARSDVFSLGIVLYELLTGRRAFLREGPVQTMQAIRADRLPLPGQIRTGLPARIDHLLARCLGKDPSLRFPDGIAMADALDEMLDAGGFDGRAAWAEYMSTAFGTQRAAENALLEQEEAAFRRFLAAPQPTPPPRAPTSGLVGRSLLRDPPPAKTAWWAKPRAWWAWAAVAAAVAGAALWGWEWARSEAVQRVDPVVIEAPGGAGE
jgi:serine/threonine-protein kinase